VLLCLIHHERKDVPQRQGENAGGHRLPGQDGGARGRTRFHAFFLAGQEAAEERIRTTFGQSLTAEQMVGRISEKEKWRLEPPHLMGGVLELRSGCWWEARGREFEHHAGCPVDRADQGDRNPQAVGAKAGAGTIITQFF